MAADRDTRSRPATTAPRELPRPAGEGASYRICVVCLGNICRSPTAEVVLREELDRAGLGGRVTVESAGTGDWHIGGPMDPGARAELARRGYDGSAHVARQITADWRGAYDLFVVMDRMNLANLRRMFADGPAQARIRLMRSFDPAAPDGAEVPDPYHGTPAEYGAAFDLVLAAARGLTGELAALLADQPGPGGNGSPGPEDPGAGASAGRP
ncbi:MAG TPA: low molecular weight protein-tyrosine-phosphatase [Streptosporangiaceae bacterium]|nr:low molecular weight protein-tyrosine-phosphatase [Streptosporangiaceae bacterium]